MLSIKMLFSIINMPRGGKEKERAERERETDWWEVVCSYTSPGQLLFRALTLALREGILNSDSWKVHFHG